MSDKTVLTNIVSVRTIFAMVVAATVPASAAPLTTAFTYQGQLKQDGVPLDGTVNLVFQLFDAETSGTQVGSNVARDAVPVANGLFSVELDFGVDAFEGSARWLQASVSGVLLSPRQPLTPAPYALQTRGIVVSPGGNVGIGTNAPTSILHFQRPFASTAIRFQTRRVDQGAPNASLRAPSAAATSGAGEPWNTPLAALTSNDAHATSSFSQIVGEPDAEQSRSLDLTAFGFALPAGAQINGFTVQIEGRATGSCSNCEAGVVNVSAELLGGSAESLRTSFTPDSSDSVHVAGGTFDSWGLDWTREQVNAAAFGVRLSANLVVGDVICIFGSCGILPCDCAGTGSASIDAVSVTVHFFDEPTTSTPFDWTVGLSEEDSNFRIAATPNLSSPVVVVTSQGSVGIGTTEFSNGFFKLAVNGAAAKPGGGQWSTLSDARLKRNVEPLSDALERMLALRGVTFEFTDEGLRTGLAAPGRQTGLIAQEVEEVFPDWVTQTPNGHKFVTEQGTTALLVEALRELRAEKDSQIAEKSAQIEALKARLARLERFMEESSREP
jgi:hypothetical protein